MNVHESLYVGEASIFHYPQALRSLSLVFLTRVEKRHLCPENYILCVAMFYQLMLPEKIGNGVIFSNVTKKLSFCALTLTALSFFQLYKLAFYNLKEEKKILPQMSIFKHKFSLADGKFRTFLLLISFSASLKIIKYKITFRV